MTALERALIAFFLRAGTDRAARMPMIRTTTASSRRLNPETEARPSFRKVDSVKRQRTALEEPQVRDGREQIDLRLQLTDAGGFKSVLRL